MTQPHLNKKHLNDSDKVIPYLDLRKELESIYPVFKKTPLKTKIKNQNGLLEMFWISLNGTRIHQDQCLPKHFQNILNMFGEYWLEKRFGQRSSLYLPKIQPFYDLVSKSQFYQHSTKKGKTNGYSLKPEVEKVLIQILKSNTPLKINPFPKLKDPNNGILDPTSSPIRIQPFIHIDLKVVDLFIQKWESITSKQSTLSNPVTWKDKQFRNRGLILRKILISGNGKVFNGYKKSPFGRLQGFGSFHLQSTPKGIRKEILGGQNLYDYDFVSCHPTIFSNLCKHHGILTPHLDHYLINRKM